MPRSRRRGRSRLAPAGPPGPRTRSHRVLGFVNAGRVLVAADEPADAVVVLSGDGAGERPEGGARLVRRAGSVRLIVLLDWGKVYDPGRTSCNAFGPEEFRRSGSGWRRAAGARRTKPPPWPSWPGAAGGGRPWR